MSDRPHLPVLLDAVLNALIMPDRPPQRVIDGTVGAGGHARALLEAGAESLLGLDRDPDALALARENLAGFGARTHLVHGSYLTLRDEARRLGWEAVDAILLDLGLSSMQLDTPDRGFAFMREGPLDMRFDPSSDAPTAADLINTYDDHELADIFFRYGEEQHSRRIARAILKARPIHSTTQLASLIAQAVPRQRGSRIHPATRVFQALRIAVNDELTAVERVLPLAVDLLRPGGRLAVISFHSLEDRLVKQYFRDASTEIVSPPGMMLEEKRASLALITRKPIEADEAEVAINPRSRSAKLRVVEKR
jgi:16S rRNA (cytosine1402-N4)-methyltransferase